tara:strand:+ start:113 stop:562 length:450 start_codon:yes stop_codon:yes gene_type:complete
MYDIFIKLATALLQKVANETDKHTSQKATISSDSDSVTLSTPDYLQFAIYGRGPGKRPPLDNILQFVKGKNIVFDGLDQRGTAFAIQASIGKKGTSNWVPNAPNALEGFIEDNLGEYLGSLNVQLLDKNSKDVEEIYDKNIPTQMKFKT